jgi:hypothetical protein
LRWVLVGATAVVGIWLMLQVNARVHAQGAAQAPARGAAPRPSPFVPPESLDDNDHTGWTSIFDGRTLDGWDGNPEVWSVADGAITAESTADRRLGSTHLIWRGGDLADFEWMLDLKLDGDIHSGVAYRSSVDLARGAGGAGRGGPNAPKVPSDPKWTLYGPGLDYDADLTMAGNVEERGTNRREIAWRGGIVRANAGVRPRLIGSVGDADALKAVLKPGDWNRIHIIARGHQLTHIINGHVMTVLFDDDPQFFRASGLIGLQIEMYGLGRVSAKNIWIKRF